jgi:threonine dehydratase
MQTTPPTFADVEAAASRIAPYAVETPLLENALLDARLDARILIKPETLQRTGSFKFRGACNRILMIPEAERARGVVAFSSGNHAQGVAAAAKVFGIPATIVMPSDAPKAKIAGTRSHGADVVFYDRHKDDREAIAETIRAKSGATLVRPFDDAGIVAGQGTIGLELARQAGARGLVLDAVLVPAGGGGIVAGIALALSGTMPDARVTGVEPDAFDGMRRSLEAGERVRAPAAPLSVADALMAPMPGAIPFAVAKDRLAPGIVVTDAEMLRAVSFAAQRLKLIVEPGGAAALAALLAGKFPSRGKTIAIILTGGNCDMEMIAEACASFPDP